MTTRTTGSGRTTHTLAGWFAAIAMAGCGSAPVAEAPVASPSASSVVLASSSDAALASANVAPSSAGLGAPPSAASLGRSGPAALIARRVDRPNDPAVDRAAKLEALPPRALPAPPFAAFVRADRAPTASAKPRLVQRSSQRNQITDDAAWFQRNELAPHGFVGGRPVGGGQLPPGIPAKVGGLMTLWGHTSPTGTALVLGPDWSGGSRVAVLAPDGAPRELFDFAAWSRAPITTPGDEDYVEQRVRWAEVHGDVLYVATSHSTYAKSSAGKNAFVSAIDLRDGALLWQSAPLVANGENFLTIGDWIVCGYGFTAEPDALFVLDRATGKTIARSPLPSGPSQLVLKGGTLFVRTYDHDLSFQLELPGGVAAPTGRRD
jgi:hypothetical protein